MKLKPILILPCLLLATTVWGQITPDKAERMRLDSEMEYLNIESVKAAYDDFCADPGYDAAKYGAKLRELESAMSAAAPQDYDAIARIVALKREILLSNPLLDDAKVLVGRYRIGEHAREVWAPSLGTQANNWSNQSSAARSGFDAEIAELSNLRGDVAVRTVYKPANSTSVTDLLLNWDGERILFTAADENNRWSVYEVRRDGTACTRPSRSTNPTWSSSMRHTCPAAVSSP